ncbi:hypothetical protein PCG10_010136 [Penicillium crustosum]|uniref:Uncharacterized protein n=1 Tax=Penicillium crustosum TaxID=36656 RepID=A0A9P5GFC7_PENCR|nr:uncharacterized protein N7487_007546 [Penicillium crustosum]KAF7519274.1 hypothetical protein PCG10_010136 [Penicillium crustosum]KAJ5401650.1 hypothetical protein N7487_007546 [Penicillium crustosum]
MSIHSQYEPVKIPEVDIWDFIFENERREFKREKPIYISAQTKRHYTWSETEAAALKFGATLIRLWDWRKGDVLGLFSPNCIDSPAIVFGTLWSGGTISAANPAYTVDELAFQLKDSHAKALVTQLAYLDVATKAAQIVGIPKDRIILIGDDLDTTDQFKHFSLCDNMCFKVPKCQKPTIDPKRDLALLAYSSGTTGRPKAVMLSHENLVANLLQIQATDEGNLKPTGGDDDHGDKILATVPYFHVYGFSFLILTPAYRGLTTVVMSKYDQKGFLDAVQSFRPTYAALVPPIILQLAKSPLVDTYDISSLKMVMCGAAPLTRELIEELYQKHKLPVRQVYGLSETSPVALVQRWHNCRDKPGSVGTLLPNMTAKFCDEEGIEIAPGQTAELYLRGPNVFLGYLNNRPGTSACLDEGGWFRTGDIGHVDQGGNFFITDRAKELIKYNGFQVAPAELEGILLDHPNIMDAAVVGIYSKEHVSELPRAYVVLAHGVGKTQDEAQEICWWLEKRVAPHKRLRGGVRFVDEIPRNPSGKILRRKIRARLNEDGNSRDETTAAKL